VSTLSKVVAAVEVSDWSKLPRDLQFKFFEYAAEERDRVKRRIGEVRAKLDFLRPHVKVHRIGEGCEWKNLRVGVVDGSCSPSMSDRLGGRIGVYSYGYQIFEGNRLVEEWVDGGRVSMDQTGNASRGNKLLSLVRWRAERGVAVPLLNRVDLLLLDGSFFGFRALGKHLRGTDMDETTRLSKILFESGKAIGVIKRVRSNIIDGWLAYHYDSDDFCLSMNDKYILSMLMNPGTYFSYASLLGRGTDHFFYNFYREALKERRKIGVVDPDSILTWAKRRVVDMWRTNLGVDPVPLMGSERYFVRCCVMPPFLFEAPASMDEGRLEEIFAYFQAFHNPATGLPFPIDTVDDLVSLPRGFQREFVDEVQAQLIGEGVVDSYFEYLNPQKEED
jgi:hypothetical protein